jgi:hypothetical protein
MENRGGEMQIPKGLAARAAAALAMCSACTGAGPSAADGGVSLDADSGSAPQQGGLDGGLPGCDGVGAPSVPSDYPQLGAGCPSHFTFNFYDGLNDRSLTRNVSGSRGVRPVAGPVAGRFALGSKSSIETTVAIFIPSLAPGGYRDGDGAEVAWVDIIGTDRDSAFGSGAGAFVQIVGSTPQVIFGRFSAIACNMTGDGTCDAFMHGRFSATVETSSLSCSGTANGNGPVWCDDLSATLYPTPHPDPAHLYPAAPICETTSDCPTPFTDYSVSTQSSVFPTCDAPVCRPPLYVDGWTVDDHMGECYCP